MKTIQFDGQISIALDEKGDMAYFFFYPKDNSGQYFYKGKNYVLQTVSNGLETLTIDKLAGAKVFEIV
jgi:hypothetical protein